MIRAYRNVVAMILFLGVVVGIGSCAEDTDSAQVRMEVLSVPTVEVRPPVVVRARLVANKPTHAAIGVFFRTTPSQPWQRASLTSGTTALYDILLDSLGTNITIVWDAAADLDADSNAVQLRFEFDGQTLATTEEFAVNISNQPPQVQISGNPPRLIDSQTYLDILATDSDDAEVAVFAKLHIPGKDEFLSLPIIDAAGMKKDHVVVGSGSIASVRLALADVLPAGVYRNCSVELIAYDELGVGREFVWITDVEVEQNLTMECSAPSGTQRGLVNVLCNIRGNAGGMTSIEAYFRNPLRPHTDWQRATLYDPVQYVSVSPYGVNVPVFWLSANDLPNRIANAVEFEVRIEDGSIRSRVTFDINNAQAVRFVVVSEIFPGSLVLPKFIELYGRPGADLSGYALLEVRKDGQYDRTKMRGFLPFEDGLKIPESGFLVISSELIGWANIVDERLDTFFLFGFPTNLLIIKPLEGTEFFDPDKTPIVDAVGFGSFGAANVFLGRCELSRMNAEEEGEELLDCPVSAAAPSPEFGYSVCRRISNLDGGENSMDFDLCTPTPGNGKLLPVEE